MNNPLKTDEFRMVEAMELPTGFKKTKIGVIPNDWVVKPIGDIVKIFVGGDLQKENYSKDQDSNYKYPVYSNTVSNEGLYGFYNIPEYSGESLTVVGRGVGLGTAFKRNGEYSAIGRLLVLMPHKDIDAKYLTEFINYKINIFFESSGVPQLTGISFAKYKVALPPTKTEQTAIATALHDADALISSLEKLIAKKRNIKQGAMQDLLTGKRRLPGFEKKKEYKQTEVGIIPIDWGFDEIENIADITTGAKNTQDRVLDGDYPFFVRSQTVERINSYSFDGEAVLTAGDGVGTGKVFHYIKGKFDFHQRVYKISNFSDHFDGYFFYLYFSNNFYNRIIQMTAKSSVDSVRRDMIAKMLIPVPPKTEQTAIAQILSDINAEIESLERKLEKYKLIKQGMMQNLLTGRIRFV